MDTETPKTSCPDCELLRQEVAELKAIVKKLVAALEESRRSGKRQAAPFRKKSKKKNGAWKAATRPETGHCLVLNIKKPRTSQGFQVIF